MRFSGIAKQQLGFREGEVSFLCVLAYFNFAK